MTTAPVVAADRREITVPLDGQVWAVSWRAPPTPPEGTPHGAEGVCVTDQNQVVLISPDGERWVSRLAARKGTRARRRRFVARCSKPRARPLSERGCSDSAEASALRDGKTVARVCLNAEQRLGRLEAGQLDANDWRYWERVINQFGIVIDRSRGQAHPLYADMTYPIDYGHIPGITASDGQAVDAFVGSTQAGLVGVIALIHQPTGIADPKLLVGVTWNEAQSILACLDRGDPGPGLNLVWRHQGRRVIAP